MSVAVSEPFGHLGRDAARGLALRHEHGSAFMSDDFQRQVKACVDAERPARDQRGSSSASYKSSLRP